MEPQNISSNNFFGIKVSQPNINVNTAANNQLIMQDDYSTRIYYDSNGVPHVILGLRGANASNGLSQNEQGLYVSQEGIDVTNATDAQLIFNSGQNIFKIADSGSFSTTLNYGNSFTTQVIFSHNLGYVPGTIAYLAINNSFSALSPYLPYVANSFMLLPNTIYYEQTISGIQTLQPIFVTNTTADINNIYFNTTQFAVTADVTYIYTYQYYILAQSLV